MRVSKYKQDIINLFSTHHTLSLQVLCEKLNKPDFSTVYRNVEQLCAEGVLKKVYLDTKTTHYELASHCHGHFFCTACKKVEPLECSEVQTRQGIISDITVSGVCSSCERN